MGLYDPLPVHPSTRSSVIRRSIPYKPELPVCVRVCICVCVCVILLYTRYISIGFILSIYFDRIPGKDGDFQCCHSINKHERKDTYSDRPSPPPNESLLSDRSPLTPPPSVSSPLTSLHSLIGVYKVHLRITHNHTYTPTLVAIILFSFSSEHKQAHGHTTIQWAKPCKAL